VAVCLGVGFGALTLWRREAQPPPKPQASQPTPLPSGSEVQISGKLEAQKVVGVAAPIAGTLEDSSIKPGDEVTEGQVILHLRNNTLEENEKEAAREQDNAVSRLNALESALIAARLESSRMEADLSRARSEYSRLEKIYQRQQLLNREGATARKTYEAAEKDFQEIQTETANLEAQVKGTQTRVDKIASDIEAARQSLADREREAETARQVLKAADIRSPVDGAILEIRKKPGEDVERGEVDLVRIAVDLLLLQVALEPDAAILARLTVGQPALIQAAEIPGDGIPATVREIKDGKAYVEFASPTPVLRPGMSVLVRLKVR
jgi:multidrug efflux pump subunit AcrA (membrane-fusion protein)